MRRWLGWTLRITVIGIAVMLIGSGKGPAEAPVTAQELDEPPSGENRFLVEDVTFSRPLPAAAEAGPDQGAAPTASDSTIVQDAIEFQPPAAGAPVAVQGHGEPPSSGDRFVVENVVLTRPTSAALQSNSSSNKSAPAGKPIIVQDATFEIPVQVESGESIAAPSGTIMQEGFEGSWPSSGWAVGDVSGDDGGEYLWGKWDCHPRSGTYGGWPAAAGADGSSLNCSDDYPNGLNTWMMYGPFDLSGATNASLTFYMHGIVEGESGCPFDFLFVGDSLDGSSFSGTSYCGDWTGGPDGNGYYQQTRDLSDQLGESSVWVIFAMVSDPSLTFSGITIDDISLTTDETANGTIIIEKQTIPDGDPKTFTFSGDVSGTLGDGDTASASVAPGTYSSTESVPAGWELTSISCDDGNSSGNIATATATFNVSAGETVTCTFTNTLSVPEDGRIVIEKQTIPDGDPKTFTFSGDVSGTLGDGDTAFADLAPGTYSSTEAVPAGWELTSINCDDGNSTGNVGTATATFNVEAGETVTCTFTNTADAPSGTIMQEGFEGGWPSPGWAVGDVSGDDGGEYLWGKWDCHPRSGTYGGWPAAAGADGSSLTCSDDYPNGLNTWMMYGPFDLSGATTASLTFYMHGIVEGESGCPFDFLFVGDSLDGSSFSGTSYCGDWTGGPDGNGYYQQTRDLSDQLGESSVWVIFAMVSDTSLTFSGITIDDISLTTDETANGTIIIEKQTIPDGDPKTFTFSGDVSGTLGDGDTASASVAPGTYSSTESVPAGWELTSISCDDGNSSGNLGTATATFNVSAGETVTCTFTNTADGPSGTIMQEDFEGSWPSAGWTVDDFSSDDGGEYLWGKWDCHPHSGTYGAWPAAAGADGSSLNCSDNYPNNLNTWATYGPFDLSGATSASLTFYMYGIVEFADGCPFDIFFAGDSIDDLNYSGSIYCGDWTGGLDGNGHYRQTLDVSDRAGQSNVWVGFAMFSDDTVNDVGITIDDVSLTVDGTETGTIIIEKQTIPDGDSTTFTFSGDVSGTLGDGDTASASVAPGTYTSTESVPAGWELTSISCDDGNSSGNLGTATATFNVSAGETVTCTFTNTAGGDYPLFIPLAMKNYCGGFPGPSEVEPNDVSADANGPLCFGQAYTGSPYKNVSDWDSDYFYVDVGANGTLLAQVSGLLPNHAQLQLRDAALNLLDIDADDASGNYSVSDSVTPGRYFVRVVTTPGLPPGHGNYTLVVNFS